MTTRRLRARRGMAAVVMSLVVIGAGSGIVRSLYPTTLGVRAEVLRARSWKSLDLHEPASARRSQDVARLEARYAEHPVLIVLHASVGTVFMVAGLLQFVRQLRTRHLRLHRLIGTMLVATGAVIAFSGLYFGTFIPAAGLPEATIITVVGVLFMFSLVRGVLAITRGDVRQHGEWMTRAFALALGIASVRIVAAIADLMLTPRGWPLESVFVFSLAAGWAVTIVMAEVWIARKRSAALQVTTRVGAEAGAA